MALHTPGPWRWQVNASSKRITLVGGQRRYDLTIMDFERWGMHSAGPSLRDPAIDGMNVMHKLHDRRDWNAPFPGREHHADWCAGVTHPDMLLIEAAPDLLDAHEPEREGPDFLDWVADRLINHGDNPNSDFILCLRRRADKARAAIKKTEGTQ